MTKKEEQELKRQQKLQAELERVEGMLVYEREYRPLGGVCGIDEVEMCIRDRDAVNVATTFSEKVGIDGVILTKLDGDTRGGAALSIRAVTGKPILYVGTVSYTHLKDSSVWMPPARL